MRYHSLRFCRLLSKINHDLDLAALVLRTAAKTGNPLKCVVVTGGMVHAKQFWQEAFETHLQEKHQIEQVIYLPDGINDALYTLAKKMI